MSLTVHFSQIIASTISLQILISIMFHQQGLLKNLSPLIISSIIFLNFLHISYSINNYHGYTPACGQAVRRCASKPRDVSSNPVVQDFRFIFLVYLQADISGSAVPLCALSKALMGPYSSRCW